MPLLCPDAGCYWPGPSKTAAKESYNASSLHVNFAELNRIITSTCYSSSRSSKQSCTGSFSKTRGGRGRRSCFHSTLVASLSSSKCVYIVAQSRWRRVKDFPSGLTSKFAFSMIPHWEAEVRVVGKCVLFYSANLASASCHAAGHPLCELPQHMGIEKHSTCRGENHRVFPPFSPLDSL